MVAVFPGVPLVLAKDFLLTNLFINDDLPTLDRPEKTTSGIVDSSNWSNLPYDVKNSALLKFKNISPNFNLEQSLKLLLHFLLL